MNAVMDLALDGLEVGAFEEYPGTLFDVNGKFLSHDEVRDRVERLKSLVLQICICGRNVVSYYIKIGRALLEIRDEKLYRYAHRKYESYDDVFVFSFMVFGFAKSTTYNLMGVAKRFSDDVSDGVNPRYKDFSYSKLVEFLPMRDDQIERFTPDATVQEIRELRKYWDRYGYDDQSTWSVELQRCRQRAAEEDEKKRREKDKDRTGSFLSLLTEIKEEEPQTASVPSSSAEGKIVQPLLNVSGKKVSFQNDAERKEFLSAENVKTWPLYIDVPDLDLQFRKFDFVNGDSIIASFGKYYPNYALDPNRAYDCFRLHLQTKDHPFYDYEGISTTHVLEYLKKHKNEI